MTLEERVERAPSNRAQRFHRRRQVRKITSLKRLRTCGFALDPEYGVPPTEVAERAGHSVKVLLSVYAVCLDGERDTSNARIQDLLDGEA